MNCLTDVMEVVFTQAAWADYVAWQKQDKSILKRVNQLITDIQRHPYSGIGKPEKLKYQHQGSYSRRITKEHRLVYRVEDKKLCILSVKYHYATKS